MFCRNCGTPLNDGAKFCGKCGMAVSTTELSPLPSQPSTQTEPPLEAASSVPPPVKQKHIRRNALIAVGVVVAVAAIVLVVRDSLFNHFADRADEYHSNRNYDEAIKAYSKALRIRPDAGIYSWRAAAYSSAGDIDSAIADYTQAIILKPNIAGSYSDRGKAYYKKGDYDRAITDFTQTITICLDMFAEPLDSAERSYLADFFNDRGKAYYEKGDYDRAIPDFTQAISLLNDYRDAEHVDDVDAEYFAESVAEYVAEYSDNRDGVLRQR